MKAIIPCLCIMTVLSAPIVARADQNPPPSTKPLLVTVDKTSTAVTDILAKLSSQSGIKILSDDTVIDAIGEARISAPNLEGALKTLASLDPGLTWEKITLSTGAAIPSGEDLSAAVQALRKIKSDAFSITDGAAGSTMSIQSTPPSTSTGGDKIVVYLVTNETVRQQRIDDKANAKYKQGPTAVESTMADLRSIADRFSQMTPDQQSEVMPLIWSQLRYITRSLGPEVLNRFEHSHPAE